MTGQELGWYRGLSSPSPLGGGFFYWFGIAALSRDKGTSLMTDLLYYHDAYQQEFTATITAIEGAGGATRLALDRTAFYPGGGGQPNDLGWLTIDGARQVVTAVKKEGASLWHIVGGEPVVTSDMTVHGALDWPRRHLLMRTHTAMHILCGVVWRDYGAQVTGGNMDPGEGRMDFEFASLTRHLISEIEAKCNAEIIAARDIRTQMLPRATAFQIPDLLRTKINLLPEGISQVRTVEIIGLDLQADGGTHVANTREVGQIKVVDYKSKGAINKRIYIKLGE
jgi:misacylated tRNA(Ala) deacylase